MLDGIEVRLVDESGDDALVGDAGEIWVKGPNVFQGYLDDPEQTARVLTADGWLRTGDIAVADDDGYLYLVDRAKDLDHRQRLQRVPGRGRGGARRSTPASPRSACRVPHPHTGEAVKAFVVPAPGADLDEDTADRVVPRPPRPLQVPVEDHVRRRAAAQRQRQAAAPRADLTPSTTLARRPSARDRVTAGAGRGLCERVHECLTW